MGDHQRRADQEVKELIREATVNFLIRSVDHEPTDLRPQLPLRGRLVRKIAGPPRRPEYWLGELAAPVSWSADGVTRRIRHVILTARWEGTFLGAGSIVPANIWYVTDDEVLASEAFHESQATYVAIGMVRVSKRPLWWLGLRSMLSANG